MGQTWPFGCQREKILWMEVPGSPHLMTQISVKSRIGYIQIHIQLGSMLPVDWPGLAGAGRGHPVPLGCPGLAGTGRSGPGLAGPKLAPGVPWGPWEAP